MTELPMRAARLARERLDPAALGAWLVPVALILYLGLNSGGYEIIERSQVGIAVWWVVLVGTAVGLLPAAGGTTVGRVMFTLLALFALWTGLALGWTESAERTAIELGRVAAYLGVFALALGLQREGRWRHMLNGVTVGVTLVVGIAVLSRLEPSWFPEQETGRLLPGAEIESRLAYPLNYSSGLSALAALSLPLLLAATGSARTLPMQAAAAAAIPVVALALWFTGSSQAVPLGALGVALFLLLAPDRLPKVASLVVGAAGGAVLIAAAEGRDALDRGLGTEAAQRQGDELELIVIAVCAVVAIAQFVLGAVLRRWERPHWLTIPRNVAVGALALGMVIVAVGALAAGAPAELSDRWDDFRSLDATDPTEDPRKAQVLDVSSNGRYQYWRAAVDAEQTEPLVGIGPGTFEFWWAREGSFEIFIRDAHSLYMEVLAELGIVGLLLISAISVGVLGLGVARVLRSSESLRLGLAAATAGCAVFVAGAAVDWIWELAVLPAAFLLLAAIVVTGGAGERSEPSHSSSRDSRSSFVRHLSAAAVIAIALVALVAITIPLAGHSTVQASRSDAAANRLAEALGEARAAQRLQPYAATPRLQEALLLEREGDLDGAVKAAREAGSRESTNWRVWLILSRLEAQRGNAAASVAAYREASALTPRSLPR